MNSPLSIKVLQFLNNNLPPKNNRLIFFTVNSIKYLSKKASKETNKKTPILHKLLENRRKRIIS